MGQRVGHGHQRQTAPLDDQPTGIKLLDQAAGGQDPGGLVAMHGPQHDQPRSGRQAVELVYTQVVGVGHSSGLRR